MKDINKIAIVGSSPISLFEAIYQAKKGSQVVVYDSSDRIGGAWSSIEYENGLNLEMGCHIWDVDKETYRFIERFLDQKLKPLKPYPLIIYKKRAFPYDWKNNILLLKTLKHDLKGYVSGKKFIKPILKSRKYKYPEGGSKQLLDRLLEELNQLGVKVILNSTISKVNQVKGGWDITVNENDEFVNQLILTSLSGINSVNLNNKIIKPKYKSSTFYHFHLILGGVIEKKKLSYVRIMGHKFIHRVSDITAYSHTKNQIISVGVFKDKVKGLADDDIVRQIKKYLINRGWIQEDREIIAYHSNQFKTKTIDHFEIKEIKKIKGINVLRSTNFIFGLGNNIDRWSKVIFDEQ